MKKKNIKKLLFFAVAFIFLSCSSNDDDFNKEIENPKGFVLSLTPSDGQVTASNNTFSLKIETTGDWTAESNQPWCTISKQEGSGNYFLNGTIASNTTTEERIATVTIKVNGIEKSISITQLGKDNNSISINLESPKDGNITAEGGDFSISIIANGEWSASVDQSWGSISKSTGTGSSTLTGKIEANIAKDNRVIKIIIAAAGGKEESITLTQKGKEEISVDPDPDPSRPTGYAGRYEVPKLKGGPMNQFLYKTVNYNGENKFLNYCSEYSYEQKQPYWVAFTFDNVRTKKNVKRKDSFKVDTDIPSKYQTVRSDYGSPYNRGHLVASSDRLFSREANQQTFFYSNMSPQIINFNSGVWNKMELKVRDWADNLNASDTIYVAKGGFIDGTIADGTLVEYYGNHVAVPRHYFMAVLSFINGQYKAMAFWIDQKNYTNKNISTYAISVDELEEKTGIDFFHNVPNEIENNVESNFSKSDWSF